MCHIDYTQDFRGFLLAHKLKDQYQKLCKVFKGSQLGGYKNLKTSLQFVFKNNSVRDYRVNVYNKWVNLLECESIAKLVGMGTKSLFFCSPTMFKKHEKCEKDGMTRIEVSKEMYSADQELAFLKSK